MSGTDIQPQPTTGYRPRFTPTEQRIMDLTADGKQHTRAEMLSCLNDELSTGSLHVHVYNIRRKLEILGETIVVESLGNDTIRYRRVRFLESHIRDLFGISDSRTS